MIIVSDEILPVLQELAQCVVDELDERGLPGVDVTTIQPGAQPVNDYAGNGKNCAELILNVTQVYPSGAGFPAPAEAATCAVELAYEIAVGILRCAPAMTGGSTKPKPPTPAATLESTALHIADMRAMHTAIRCCLGGKREYVVRGWQPYGPNGGVVGGTWVVVVGGEA